LHFSKNCFGLQLRSFCKVPGSEAGAGQIWAGFTSFIDGKNYHHFLKKNVKIFDSQDLFSSLKNLVFFVS